MILHVMASIDRCQHSDLVDPGCITLHGFCRDSSGRGNDRHGAVLQLLLGPASMSCGPGCGLLLPGGLELAGRGIRLVRAWGTAGDRVTVWFSSRGAGGGHGGGGGKLRPSSCPGCLPDWSLSTNCASFRLASAGRRWCGGGRCRRLLCSATWLAGRLAVLADCLSVDERRGAARDAGVGDGAAGHTLNCPSMGRC